GGWLICETKTGYGKCHEGRRCGFLFDKGKLLRSIMPHVNQFKTQSRKLVPASSKPFHVIPPLPIPASDKRTSLLPLLLLQPGCFHGVTEQHGDRHRSGTTGRGT